MNYTELDPGIRDIVRLLHANGFETSDSGDGSSKPREWYESGEAIPFPHVLAATTPARMVADAEHMATVLGTGWIVEAEYQTSTKQAHLFARTMCEQERSAKADEAPSSDARFTPSAAGTATGSAGNASLGQAPR